MHRGVSDPEQAVPFLDATLAGLSSPAPMADRAEAEERTKQEEQKARETYKRAKDDLVEPKDQIIEAYKTGRGGFRLRAKWIKEDTRTG